MNKRGSGTLPSVFQNLRNMLNLCFFQQKFQKEGLEKSKFPNKRGDVSAFAATMIVIVVTVLLIAILWMIVISFLKTSMLDKTECVYADVSLSIDGNSKYTCSSGSLSKILVERRSYSGNVIAIQIKHGNDDGDVFIKQFNSVPRVNTEKVYEIEKKISIASVAAILSVGGKNVTCHATEEVEIKRSCQI